MTKRQLIEEIRRHNTSVAPQFLSRFDESSLRLYLERLTNQRQAVRMPRRPPPTRLRRAS